MVAVTNNENGRRCRDRNGVNVRNLSGGRFRVSDLIAIGTPSFVRRYSVVSPSAARIGTDRLSAGSSSNTRSNAARRRNGSDSEWNSGNRKEMNKSNDGCTNATTNLAANLARDLTGSTVNDSTGSHANGSKTAKQDLTTVSGKDSITDAANVFKDEVTTARRRAAPIAGRTEANTICGAARGETGQMYLIGRETTAASPSVSHIAKDAMAINVEL